jgi:hypothetical protein
MLHKVPGTKVPRVTVVWCGSVDVEVYPKCGNDFAAETADTIGGGALKSKAIRAVMSCPLARKTLGAVDFVCPHFTLSALGFSARGDVTRRTRHALDGSIQ